MTTINGGYMFGWNDHANNIKISISDLLQTKELVDVTLVADGYVFNAHRLVLAAISPHFRQMFTLVPANQQAFGMRHFIWDFSNKIFALSPQNILLFTVFMKDVTKQALEDLITFIYCGEVKVSEECFEDFLNTAKALRIRGLDDRCYERAFYSPESKPNRSTPSQFQSTQTVHVPKSANLDMNHSNFDQKSEIEFKIEKNFGHGSGDSVNENDNGMDFDTNYDYDSCIDGPSMLSTDLKFDKTNDRWNSDNKTESEETPKEGDAPKTKHSNRNFGKHSFGSHL